MTEIEVAKLKLNVPPLQKPSGKYVDLRLLKGVLWERNINSVDVEQLIKLILNESNNSKA